MARLIVVAKDKVNTESVYLDVMCYKRGMVINTYDDGFDLESYPGIMEEVKAGRWQIVDVPKVDKESLTAFLVKEVGQDIAPDNMLQRRGFKFNLDTFNPNNLTQDANNNLTVVLNAKEQVAKRADPNVIE